MKIHIEYRDQFGHWKYFKTEHHEPSAYRTAQQRAQSTGSHHRLGNEQGVLLELIDP